MTYDELDNMHLHIENYILSHLRANVCKLYMICKENSSQKDDEFIELYNSIQRKTDIIHPVSSEMKESMADILFSTTINRHWIFSKNELFLNRQYEMAERMRKAKGEWKGVTGEDHFYTLNQFSVLRRLNISNNPVISVLSSLLKNTQIL